MEANRLALQLRANLLPYVYNGHRSAFDTGVGIIRPMYYYFPELDPAYAMDNNGNSVQYMFGPSILFSPVVTAGDATQNGMGPGMASKTTWLPPGTWVDANTGVVTTVAPTDSAHYLTKSYAINEVPLWFVAGSVIPYVPLRSQASSIGNGAKQYTFLGFKIVPGGSSGNVSVYEDDGATTAYLTSNAFAWTTATYTSTGSSLTVTISTAGSYPQLPATRAYQIRVLNGAPVSSVTVNGVTVPYNRFGKIASVSKPPPANQYYYDFSLLPDGMGPVIDLVGVSTTATTTVTIQFGVQVNMAGVYGAVTHALWAKGNLDIERSTPGSNSDDPAYTSVLSSIGQALEYLAGNDTATFVDTVNSVPALLSKAIAEVGAMSSSRKSYSVALLQNGMI